MLTLLLLLLLFLYLPFSVLSIRIFSLFFLRLTGGKIIILSISENKIKKYPGV
jgi:hypothetical protein